MKAGGKTFFRLFSLRFFPRCPSPDADSGCFLKEANFISSLLLEFKQLDRPIDT